MNINRNKSSYFRDFARAFKMHLIANLPLEQYDPNNKMFNLYVNAIRNLTVMTQYDQSPEYLEQSNGDVKLICHDDSCVYNTYVHVNYDNYFLGLRDFTTDVYLYFTIHTDNVSYSVEVSSVKKYTKNGTKSDHMTTINTDHVLGGAQQNNINYIFHTLVQKYIVEYLAHEYI